MEQYYFELRREHTDGSHYIDGGMFYASDIDHARKSLIKDYFKKYGGKPYWIDLSKIGAKGKHITMGILDFKNGVPEWRSMKYGNSKFWTVVDKNGVLTEKKRSWKW